LLFPFLPLLITYKRTCRRSRQGTIIRFCMCISCFKVEAAPQSTDRGRVEIEGVYLPSQLGAYTTTLYVIGGHAVDIVKWGGRRACTPQPHQAGLIFPSWWNIRQKLGIATLLYSVIAEILVMVCILRGMCEIGGTVQSPNSWTKSRQSLGEFSSMFFSHLNSFALRCLFLQTHATSYSFCKEEKRKLDRKPYPVPYSLRSPYRNLKSEKPEREFKNLHLRWGFWA
jgi:hypothetical protein